jgi:hypothetical protein
MADNNGNGVTKSRLILWGVGAAAGLYFLISGIVGILT